MWFLNPEKTVSQVGSGFFMDRDKQPLSDFERQFYQRNILVPEIGETGQMELLRSRVLVIGAGGLGSPALFYLAVSGIGEIGIADGDRVEVSNLQRQILHGIEDVGKEKTVSAAETLRKIRPDIGLNLYPVRLTEENADEVVSRYDFVIEATDNFQSKFLINDSCVRTGRPYSHAGILGMFGQTMTVVPGESPCYRCVFQRPPEPGKVRSTSEAGVLGTVPGVLGPIQATEAIKFILGMESLLTGRLLTFNASEMTFREVKLPPDKRCKVCGLNKRHQSPD